MVRWESLNPIKPPPKSAKEKIPEAAAFEKPLRLNHGYVGKTDQEKSPFQLLLLVMEFPAVVSATDTPKYRLAFANPPLHIASSAFTPSWVRRNVVPPAQLGVDSYLAVVKGGLVNNSNFFGTSQAEIASGDNAGGGWNNDQVWTVISPNPWYALSGQADASAASGLFSSHRPASAGDSRFEFSHRTILSGY